MANTNYIRGRAFEYARMRHWEGKGYLTLRTAGSHGPFDIVAVRANAPVALIQCKIVQTETEARRLIRQFTENPPLSPYGKYHQVMEVKVKGGKVLDGTV